MLLQISGGLESRTPTEGGLGHDLDPWDLTLGGPKLTRRVEGARTASGATRDGVMRHRQVRVPGAGLMT
jgi:hypothetical protein